jgi:hypothetical protein
VRCHDAALVFPLECGDLSPLLFLLAAVKAALTKKKAVINHRTPKEKQVDVAYLIRTP